MTRVTEPGDAMLHVAGRPTAVVFDVNETLFDLHPLGAAMEDVGLPGPALDLWFSRVLADAFAIAAAGDFAPFAALAEDHLRRLLRSYGLHADPATVTTVLAAFDELELYADVTPALRRLRAAGVRVATLTNGDASVTETLLARHGLDELVEVNLDVSSVGAWKPRPEPYLAVARELNLPPSELGFVSAHGWDVHGARRAGLVGAWVSRLEREWLRALPPPEVAELGLLEAVEALLHLPQRVS